MRIAIPGLLGLVACTPIYDAQYNDRADELEAFRLDFRPEKDETSLLASGGARVFWVAKKVAEDQTFLHSMVPGDLASELVYQWSMDDNSEGFDFSDQLIVRCEFSTARAFAVSNPQQAAPFEPMKSASPCAVDGGTVWLDASDGTGAALFKWVPPGTVPMDVGINLSSAGIAKTLGSLGVKGNLAVATEQDGDLYRLDLETKVATFLNNDEPVIGESVLFDERGVLYQGQNGPRYLEFDGTDDPPDTSLDAMVRDGGYHLSFKHGDIQQPAGDGEYFLHDRHVIYRGQRGIFAYGLDTHNVIDLLLDRGEGIDLELAYHQPAVTAGRQLFVFGTDSLGIGLRGPVFQLDLEGRLR